MRSAPQKLKLLLVSLFLVLFVFVPYAHAESWSAWFQSQFSFKTLLWTAICEIAGPPGCLSEKKNSSQGALPGSPPELALNKEEGSGGLIGFTTNTMISMYSYPPTSSTYYLAQVGREFGVVPETYAQVSMGPISGSGAGLIQPVYQLWQVLRNVSYLFFIFIFVAIGFMIMFRQKLNAQTVISIQSALPGLVVGLILVTFSYFLSALIVDLAFLGIQIVAQIFISVQADGKILNLFQDPQRLASDSNLFSLFTNSIGASWTSVDNNIWNFYSFSGQFAKDAVTTTGGAVVEGVQQHPKTGGFAALIGLIVGGAMVFATGGQALLGGAAVTAGAVLIAPLIIKFILVIAFAIQFLKLTYKLLMAYVMILLSTALGPLYITMSVLPGRGNMMGVWWKNILGNVLVFPAVFAQILFAGMILALDPKNFGSTPPLFGGLNTQLLQPMIGFVILLGTPAIPDMVKKAVGATDLGDIGKTGVAGFTAGYGVGKSSLDKLTSRYQQRRKSYAGYLEKKAEQQWAKPGQLPPWYVKWFNRSE